jgi:hypothetical protein
MTELAFIQFDGGDDSARKKEKRQAVRAHVMKNFHRERKREVAQRRINRPWETWDGSSYGTVGVSKPTTIENEALCAEELQATLRQGDDDHGLATRNLSDYSPASLHADRSLLPVFHTHALIDERGFHPILKIRDCRKLTSFQVVADIEHNSSLLSSSPASSPFSTDWLPATRIHPYLYHASVFVCSASTETLSQKTLSFSSYYHRTLAIRLINEQLRDPKKCKSDETVAAILSLANFEVCML